MLASRGLEDLPGFLRPLILEGRFRKGERRFQTVAGLKLAAQNAPGLIGPARPVKVPPPVERCSMTRDPPLAATPADVGDRPLSLSYERQDENQRRSGEKCKEEKERQRQRNHSLGSQPEFGHGGILVKEIAESGQQGPENDETEEALDHAESLRHFRHGRSPPNKERTDRDCHRLSERIRAGAAPQYPSVPVTKERACVR